MVLTFNVRESPTSSLDERRSSKQERTTENRILARKCRKIDNMQRFL